MRFLVAFLFLSTLPLSACLPYALWPDWANQNNVSVNYNDAGVRNDGDGDRSDVQSSDVVEDDAGVHDVARFTADASARDASAGDASAGDASAGDASARDVNAPDASANGLDAGGNVFDVNSADAVAGGGPFGTIFMEIDYISASFATTPSRTYSQTPAFTEQDWAPDRDGYRDFPEVWDIFDGIEIRNNAWGQGADIDGNDRLQWMFGLQELSSIEVATLEIWGSGDFGSSTLLNVTNPLFGCGEALEIPFNPQDELLRFVVDMTGCVTAGDDVQAIRIEQGLRPFSLQRMRLTLEGAR